MTTKTIKVSLANLRLEAYEGRARIFAFDCVTGDSSHPTDRGTFKIFNRQHPYRSRTYGAQMDYALFSNATARPSISTMAPCLCPSCGRRRVPTTGSDPTAA